MNSTLDLTPDTLDLDLYAGDIGDFEIDFLDANGDPFDVSNFIWLAQIRNSRVSTAATNLSLDLTDADTGVIIVHIPPTLTRELADTSWGRTGDWDIQASTSDHSITVTILQGSVRCFQDVAR